MDPCSYFLFLLRINKMAIIEWVVKYVVWMQNGAIRYVIAQQVVNFIECKPMHEVAVLERIRYRLYRKSR